MKLLWICPVLLAAPAAVLAQPAGDADAVRQERHKRLTEMLSGVRLVGRFTMLGKEDQQLSDEEYTIKKVTKLPQGDYWLFLARIKYGKKDYTVPLPLEVKWAGDTPMITLTDFKILGQGPYSARVLFYNQKYAGTWSHGDVGGHLFGRIERIEIPPSEKADKPPTP